SLSLLRNDRRSLLNVSFSVRSSKVNIECRPISAFQPRAESLFPVLYTRLSLSLPLNNGFILTEKKRFVNRLSENTEEIAGTAFF
ncbi:MAG: hypothetical protein PUJ49_06715, partial [bacterium]|nr:hypothetical protein [bacterium]